MLYCYSPGGSSTVMQSRTLSVSATERPFDCTFDEDDYCGYSDESEGPVKWLRSKAHELSSPGKQAVCILIQVGTCTMPYQPSNAY